jgi:hypothetical protein
MVLKVRALAWLLALSACTATLPARAQAAEPRPAEYPASRCAGLGAEPARRCEELSAPEPLGLHDRNHDGLFVRGGFGFSAYQAKVPGVDDAILSTSAEVLVGGTPFRGLVLGGGVIGEGLGTPHPLLAYSAFAQLYPDPHGGLHFQLLGALALLNDHPSVLGPLAAAGVGFDAFVGGQVSLGGFARIGYARGYGDGGVSVDAPFASLAATFTWH